MAARKRKNPFISPSEVLLWIFFVALLFPAAFAGYAVGHYTSLGKPPETVTKTVGTATTPTMPTTTAATTTSSSGGDAAAGKTVFDANGCGSCHTFTLAGSNGAVGPNLDNAIAASAKDDGNMALAAFIKESIVKPSAYIAKGYSDGIMPQSFGSSLTATQLNDLVAFILSGTQK